MHRTKKLTLPTMGLIVTLLSLLHSTVPPARAEATTKSYLEIGPRIISGKPTTSEKHPHVVRIVHHFYNPQNPMQIFSDEGHGALLTLKWVVTAAHVINGTSTDSLQVIAGMTFGDELLHLTPTVQMQRVCLYVINPMYKFLGERQNYLNDLAMVKLRAPFYITPNVRALGFKSIPDYKGDEQEIYRQFKSCIAAGWGSLGEPDVVPEQIQEARFDLVNVDDCLRMEFIYHPTFGSVCTHSEHSALYNGDSGTPLICRGKSFIGTHFGGPFNVTVPKTGRMNVFTRVDYWKGWMLEVVAAYS